MNHQDKNISWGEYIIGDKIRTNANQKFSLIKKMISRTKDDMKNIE